MNGEVSIIGKKLRRMEECGPEDNKRATYHIYANYIYCSAKLSSYVSKLLFEIFSSIRLFLTVHKKALFNRAHRF